MDCWPDHLQVQGAHQSLVGLLYAARENGQGTRSTKLPLDAYSIQFSAEASSWVLLERNGQKGSQWGQGGRENKHGRKGGKRRRSCIGEKPPLHLESLSVGDEAWISCMGRMTRCQVVGLQACYFMLAFSYQAFKVSTQNIERRRCLKTKKLIR